MQLSEHNIHSVLVYYTQAVWHFVTYCNQATTKSKLVQGCTLYRDCTPRWQQSHGTWSTSHVTTKQHCKLGSLSGCLKIHCVKLCHSFQVTQNFRLSFKITDVLQFIPEIRFWLDLGAELRCWSAGVGLEKGCEWSFHWGWADWAPSWRKGCDVRQLSGSAQNPLDLSQAIWCPQASPESLSGAPRPHHPNLHENNSEVPEKLALFKETSNG